MRFYKLIFLLTVFLLLVSCEQESFDDFFKLKGASMGTIWHLTVVNPPTKLRSESLRINIVERLRKLNDQMSTWKTDSELSNFNRYTKKEWFSVSQEVLTVMTKAQTISEMTEGAFDVTVAPLVQLWGFSDSYQFEFIPPNEKQIQHYRMQMGYQKLRLQQNPSALAKTEVHLSVDVSAIAKGYAVDLIADYLEKIGVERYLIEIGGEIRCSGLNARQEAWRIAIESPINIAESNKVIQQGLYLKKGALATSGDYRNFFDYKGKRYSHTINPLTGYPVAHQLASVTVMANTTMEADALATALMVMGENKGFDFAREKNIAAYFIFRVKKGFESKATDGFKALLALK